MNIIDAQLKPWGNSLGVVIPMELVSNEGLNKNSRVRILVLKDSRKAFKKTFGIGKGKIKGTAQEFKDEARRELY